MLQLRRIRFVVVLGLCAAAGLIATVAVAGEKQAVISATGIQASSGETHKEYAPCTGNKRALGGGLVQGEAFDPNDFWIEASGPLGPSGTPSGTTDGDIAKRWSVTVYTSNGPRSYKVFAICARAPGATLEVRSFLVDGFEMGTKSVECPGSKRALGGGVLPIGSANRIDVLASGPVDRSGKVSKTKNGDVAKRWLATVANFTEDNHKRFKVFAICAPDSDATITTGKFKVPASNGSEKINGVAKQIKCPGSKRATGGGVTPIDPPSGLRVQASGPLDNTADVSQTTDGDKARFWYVAITNFTDNEKEAKLSANLRLSRGRVATRA